MHKQAALNTLKIVASAAVTGVIVTLAIEYLTLSVFLSVLGTAAIAYFVYVCYCIEKSRLESIDRLNKMSEE